MTVQKLSRREALKGTGVAALAAGAEMRMRRERKTKTFRPGDLAQRIAIYRWEWDRLNAHPVPNNELCDEYQAKFDKMLDETYTRITTSLIGVPALSAQDALAAMDWQITSPITPS